MKWPELHLKAVRWPRIRSSVSLVTFNCCCGALSFCLLPWFSTPNSTGEMFYLRLSSGWHTLLFLFNIKSESTPSPALFELGFALCVVSDQVSRKKMKHNPKKCTGVHHPLYNSFSLVNQGSSDSSLQVKSENQKSFLTGAASELLVEGGVVLDCFILRGVHSWCFSPSNCHNFSPTLTSQ